MPQSVVFVRFCYLSNILSFVIEKFKSLLELRRVSITWYEFIVSEYSYALWHNIGDEKMFDGCLRIGLPPFMERYIAFYPQDAIFSVSLICHKENKKKLDTLFRKTHSESLKILLGYYLNNERDENRYLLRQLLLYAVESGNLQTATTLYNLFEERFPEIYEENAGYFISLAVAKNRKNMLIALLNKLNDENKNKVLNCVIENSIHINNNSIMTLLVERTDKILGNKLLNAILSRPENYGMIKMLLDKGAEPDSYSFAYSNDLKILDLLFEYTKSNFVEMINGGITIAQVAMSSYINSLEFLLKKGCDPNKKNHWEGTALEYAHRRKDYKCINLLLQYGAKRDESQCIPNKSYADALRTRASAKKS